MIDRTPERRAPNAQRPTPGTNGSHASKIVAVYPYHDEEGRLLFEVCRRDDKSFPQRKPDGSWGIDGVRRVLFGLPELLAAPEGAAIAIAEGEKDVLSLRAAGVVATCNPGGAARTGTKWNEEYTEWLKAHLPGRRFVIFPDADEAGRNHARSVLASLRTAKLPAVIADLGELPEGGDVSDWLAPGRSAAEIRAVLSGPPPRFRFLTVIELLSKPPPEWALEGLFEKRELTICYGLYGSGKTFLTTDIVMHLTEGRPWNGRACDPHRVLYVDADGGDGFGKRIRVWQRVNGRAGEANLTIYDEPVNLFDGECVGAFIEQLEGMATGFDLVVIDTLAQCAVGADENSARDMGLVADAVRRLMRRCRTGTWITQHATKDGSSPRGIMTLANAAATVVAMSMPERAVIARCEKQRNWAKWEPMTFHLQPVDDSCLLVSTTRPVAVTGTPQSVAKAVSKEALLTLVLSEPGLTKPELMARTGIGQSTLYLYVQELVREGLVVLEALPRQREGGQAKGLFPSARAMREARG